MRKLDPQLEYLVDGGADEALDSKNEELISRFGLEMVAPAGRSRTPKAEANVLVQHSGDTDDLKKAGMTVHGVAGDVVTGLVPIDKLKNVAKLEAVERIESARPLQTELDLSVLETRADQVHAGPPGRRGAGVIVGIVDTGCDFTHPSFVNSDGTTRILAIWDQGLVPAGAESNPSGFSYGVEYTEADINAALNSASPFNVVRHRDPFLHGTHVTGIAAGDGSVAGQGHPAGTYVGVAPEADIIIVANRSNGPEGLGTSANTLDAVNYVYQKARAIDKPAVVNMSLGDNLGPHDGTSLLERGLDNLLGAQGRAFVKSAGNAGSARVHAQGNVTTGEIEDVRFNQPAGDTGANQIDLWYQGGDTFRISIVDPAGQVVGPVGVGTVGNFNFTTGNSVRIDHRNNDPFNGDRRVFITFRRGTSASIRSGTWRLRIQSTASPQGGRFDAWIQRGRIVPAFLSPHENRAITISTPGTAREVITAANYSARGFSAGSLAASSSRGPTRDGRPAPTLAAPGTSVFSASAESAGGDPYRSMSGTSMSAPHITGTIALMFQKNRKRTQAQIKQCLESSARTDSNTGPAPNTAWGHGKMDSKAAVDCVPSPMVQVSVPKQLCQPSVIMNRCRTVVGPHCYGRTVIAPNCIKPTVIDPNCLRPTVLRCPSQVIVCNLPSVAAACPSRSPIGCGGPSVVDGCPSTPRGCFNPTRPVRPGRPLGPTPVGPGTVTPARDFAQDEQADHSHDDDAAMAAINEEMAAYEAALEQELVAAMDGVEVPEEGYFDYDDSWFDPEP